MKDFKKIISYFLPTIKKYKNYLIFVPILFLLGNISQNIFVPIYYKNITNEAARQFADGIFSFESLFWILFYIFLFVLLGSVARRVGSHLLIDFENKMLTDVHQESFDKIIEQTPHFFANNFVGTLAGKVSRLATNFKRLIETCLFGFLLLFADIVLSVFILAREDFLLGGIFFFFMVVFVLFSFLFIKKQARLDKKRAEMDSRRMGVISDILTNILNLKIFSLGNSERSYYKKFLLDLDKSRLSAWLYSNRVRIYKNIFFLIFEIGVMLLALYLFTQQKISLGTLTLVQAYTFNIILSSWNLDNALTNFIEFFSDSSDAIDAVTAPILVKDPKFPEKLKIEQGDVLFNRVCFTYPKGDHVFENFSIHIPKGQSVGVVGKSGSGKTTLIKLLLRFYDVDSGDITIDGQNIASLAQDDLRMAIAYIPQETILFHRTIYENISYGNLNASKEEIIEAARSAHVDEFVQRLENGYQTKVGERGVKLSGGQRQRIGIARAMLRKNAPILIMDEATSSLDSVSERYIQESFEKLSKNRTTIVIAHRLSTIQKMDRIIVMDHGKIVEDGSHEELLKKDSRYARLWDSQVNGFIKD